MRQELKIERNGRGEDNVSLEKEITIPWETIDQWIDNISFEEHKDSKKKMITPEIWKQLVSIN